MWSASEGEHVWVISLYEKLLLKFFLWACRMQIWAFENVCSKTEKSDSWIGLNFSIKIVQWSCWMKTGQGHSVHFWSQIAVEQRSKIFLVRFSKKLQWSLKTFLHSHRHSRHAKSIFNDTSKRLTTRSCWKVYEFLHFFQFIKRSLKILLWTCILDFAEDQLNFYPTFEKKHKDLKFSKLGYSKTSSAGYTQRMQNPSPEAITQSWKKSKFCKFWEIFCFWNDIRGRTNAASTTPPVINCSKLAKIAAWKISQRILFSLKKNSSIHVGGKGDRTGQT